MKKSPTFASILPRLLSAMVIHWSCGMKNLQWRNNTTFLYSTELAILQVDFSCCTGIVGPESVWEIMHNNQIGVNVIDNVDNDFDMQINQGALRFHDLFVAHAKRKNDRSSERIVYKISERWWLSVWDRKLSEGKGTATIEKRDQKKAWKFSYEKKVHINCLVLCYSITWLLDLCRRKLWWMAWQR